MQLILEIKNTENLVDLTEADKQQMQMIVEALVSTGGLHGVKGGKTIIHFDQYGIFQRLQLDYTPWVKRSIDNHRN